MAVNPGIYAASMSCFHKNLSLNIDSTILHLEKLIKEFPNDPLYQYEKQIHPMEYS